MRHLVRRPQHAVPRAVPRPVAESIRLEPLEGRRLLSAAVDLDAGPMRALLPAVEAASPPVAGPVADGLDVDGAPAAGFSSFVPEDEAGDHDGHDELEPHGTPAPSPEVLRAAAEANAGDAAAGASLPLSQTFLLNSKPGADHVIYLDFDGHTTSGTLWNNNDFDGAGGRPPSPSSFTTPAFGTDGNAGSFSDAEKRDIQQIWERVSEDFAPFDVNVTTQYPGNDYLTKSGSTDREWGVRVVIGGTSEQWYKPGFGGVAYVNTYARSRELPAYVFENNLGSNAANIAEAASHEAGHTLGLNHDGRNGNTYYGGHDSGKVSWAPIMGSSYGRALTQWSRGEYSRSSNSQDDLAIIAKASNGFGYVADDHSDTVTGTLPTEIVPDAAGAFTATGVISRSNDQDAFRFAHGGGGMNVTATGAEVGSNLDIELRLYQWSGSSWNLIQLANPDASPDATVGNTYPAGEYAVQVDGVGRGNPLDSPATGYTDYGSLGAYTLVGAVQPAPVPVDVPTTLLIENVQGTAPLLHTGFNGDIQVGSSGASIDSPGDVDAFAFSTEQSGSVTVDAAGFGGVDVVLGLYQFDPAADRYDRIAFDDDGGFGNNARLTFDATARVRYALAVADNGADSTGDVILTFASGNTSGVGLIGLNGGEGLAAGNVGVGDTDYFSFVAPDDEVVVELNPSGGLSADLLIYDGGGNARGTVLAESGNLTTTTLTGLAAGQTYYIAAFADRFAESGDFTIGVRRVNNDQVAPRVVGVAVASSAWSGSFLAAADPARGVGYTIPTGDGEQLAALPWTGLNTVAVQFSEDVITTAEALRVTLDAALLPMDESAFRYDASTRTAVWQTAMPIGRGNLEFALSDTAVRDVAGNLLDGEWDNPLNAADADSDDMPSGDGAAGGDFAFSARTLAADINGDGSVSIADFARLRSAFGANAGAGGFDLFADLNGDGQTSIADFATLRSEFGETL